MPKELTPFQKKIRDVGPKTVAFLTGESFNTVSKWSAGQTEPIEIAQKAILETIERAKP